MPGLRNVRTLREFAAKGLIGRLSLVILLHTGLTFAAAWLLYSYPGFGANALDIAAENERILSFASQAAELAENSRSGAEDGKSRLGSLFLSAQRDLTGVRRQALYRLTATDAEPRVTTILRWEDDLSAGTRQTETEFARDRTIATALNEDRSGSVVRVLDEDFHEAVCYASVTAPSDGADPGVTFVYQVTTTMTPPVIEGRKFTTALLIVFGTTLLLGLLIVALLRQKLADPLRALNSAFEQLVNVDYAAENREPVLVPVCDTCAISGLLSNFNAMSVRLYENNRELHEAHGQISEAARELAESKALLETTVECSPDAIIVTDCDGEIEFFNRAGRELFGYTSDLAPTSINDLFVQDVVQVGAAALTDNTIPHQERLGLRADGARFPGLVICAPLRLDGVSVCGFIYVIRDISESENYREMITRLDQLSVRGEMAGDIAHEINNFLAIIQGNAELLPVLIRKGDSEKIDRRLTAINSTVARIAEFTSGLMHFEPRDLAFAPEDPNQLVHNLLSFVKPQNRLDHVTIDLQMDENIQSVELDSAMIQQILVNLVYNAADALKEHDGERRITVVTRYAETFEVSVSDTGPGVPAEKRESLFTERFTTKRKGNGIGLITCGRIAQAHNGSISYSESPSGGAQFTLSLPYRQPKREPVQADSANSQ